MEKLTTVSIHRLFDARPRWEGIPPKRKHLSQEGVAPRKGRPKESYCSAKRLLGWTCTCEWSVDQLWGRQMKEPQTVIINHRW